MHFGFEWDPAKAALNLKRHGVSFDEATTVFSEWGAPVDTDPLHSTEEDRFIIIGTSELLHLLAVVFTFRDEDTIRIISARRASRRERQIYEEKKGSA